MLAVFNIGAHYHNWTHYTEDIDVMIQLLAEANRTQDIYFFRSTSPGHDGCLPKSRKFDWKVGTRLKPLEFFSEYQSGHKYDWDQFEGYNNYTKNLLLERNRMGLQPVMHYLDIYNMTALQSDAHTAPADCLHFRSISWSCGLVEPLALHIFEKNGGSSQRKLSNDIELFRSWA